MESKDKDTQIKYSKVKTLATGAFGTAVLCKTQFGDKCVIKKVVLDEKNYKDEKSLKLAKTEGKVMKLLYHPNIVAFQDVYLTGKNQNQLNIVMEYLDGGDLQAEIDRRANEPDGPNHYSENQIYDLFTQIALGLKHIHDRRIIHRDLKAENIFLSSKGVAKIGDLGVCKVCNLDQTGCKTKIGTPIIMSPEIFLNKGYSRSTDIWSLGVILYQMCALKCPFVANNLPNLSKKIINKNPDPIPEFYGENLRSLLDSLLRKTPEDRPKINRVVKYPKIWERIGSLLSDKTYQEEFLSSVQIRPMKEKIRELKRISKQDK